MGHACSFNTYWLAETLRLREAHWGPLEDASEVRRARAQGHTFTEQILLRALFLGQREKLDAVLQKWTQGAKLALAGMIVIALLAGIGAATGSLGDGSRSVNLPLALLGLLGLHCVTFVLWLISFVLGAHSGAAWLGRLWLWLTQRLARGPDTALAPRALVELLGRNGALRWVLSGISHGIWTCALFGLLLTLLAELSARRYSFSWETTLLSADTFVHLTALIGWLPAQFGFPMPSEEVVRASNGLQTLPAAAQALWSSWLIGCVVVYGLAPRALSLAISVIQAKRNIAALTLDENLPAYANLRGRLQPASEKTGIDAPDTPESQMQRHVVSFTGDDPNRSLVAGIELAAETPWPPAALGDGVGDLGMIDTHTQRNALLDQLQQYPAGKLLLVCDGRQTPDRGTIALMSELAHAARQTHVALCPRLALDDRQDTRTELWRQRLLHAGFAAEQIHLQLASALAWLKSGKA
ncbi:MAG: DUF2868 domain-containing protein [Burkholderiaceae bacterium]